MQTLTAGITGSKVAIKGAKRHLRTVSRLAVAGAVAVALIPERHTFLDGVRRLSRLSPAWLLVAVAAEAISFLAAAELQRRLLAAVGVDIDRLPSLRLVSAAWSVSAVLPAGPAFSAAYTYRQLTRRGAGGRPAVWVLAAGGVLSVGSLILLGLIGAELCRRALPTLPAGVVLDVGAVVVVAAAAGALGWSARHPSAVRRMADALGDLLGSRLRGPLPPLAGLGTWAATLAFATINWMADLAALGVAFVSLGVAVPWRGVLLAYVVGQVAASLPLLPGSVGVAEAAMALSLAAVGTPPGAAVAVVLVYRLVSFWLPLPIGLWFWAGSRLRAPPGQGPRSPRGVLRVLRAAGEHVPHRERAATPPTPHRRDPSAMERHARAIVAVTALAGAAALIAVAVASPAVARDRDSSIAFRSGTGQSVIDWNRQLIATITTPKVQPATIHPTRSFAILQAAEFDAVVAITHADRPYLFSVHVPRRARPDAAADQAAHDVLVSLYPSVAAAADQLLATELAAIPEGTPKHEGITVGSAVAARLLRSRSSDGSAATPPPFVAGTQPGDYRPTPPNFPAPAFTNWGAVRPFVLERGSQFRPAAPPPVGSPEYAAALNEVESLGRDSSTTRTPEQTAVARFWGAQPIWNLWNEVAQNAASASSASLESAVESFSQLDLALADTAISLYDGKYHDSVWRPVTAIRLGDTAGNPGIVGDPAWTPLAVTAADPSYPGAHSGFSEAAATVLTSFYGRHQNVTVSSDGMPGVTRTFSSFQAAADEAGLSRIFAGQHTRLDHVAGQKLGRQVADFVLDNSE